MFHGAFASFLRHQIVLLGHIIGDEPRGHGVFWVLDHQTPSPGWGWSVPDLGPSGALHHCSPFLIHSHLDAFSAVSFMFLVAVLSCNPLMPETEWCMTALQSPCLQPTSMAFQPCLIHSSTSSLGLGFLSPSPSNSEIESVLLCRIEEHDFYRGGPSSPLPCGTLFRHCPSCALFTKKPPMETTE